MRIVVMSDSHSAKSNLFKIVELHLNDADLFIFLGDGEHDFDEVLMLYPQIKYKRVAGNCDWGSTHPLYKAEKIAGKNILYTHGHPFYVKHGYSNIIRECQSSNIDICLFGHTHIQFSQVIDGLHILNPGSVANGEYAMVDIVDNAIALITTKLK